MEVDPEPETFISSQLHQNWGKKSKMLFNRLPQKAAVEMISGLHPDLDDIHSLFFWQLTEICETKFIDNLNKILDRESALKIFFHLKSLQYDLEFPDSQEIYETMESFINMAIKDLIEGGLRMHHLDPYDVTRPEKTILTSRDLFDSFILNDRPELEGNNDRPAMLFKKRLLKNLLKTTDLKSKNKAFREECEKIANFS
ncbi:unnamed protein product [Caenorhabditis auriculariae]|uniref:Uncharacterized protein n=1 Tax=Caenorhabditis auriculariae TaxID=2777116 RepID=A0A8S1H2Q7_9PELO|nr:unnamed protein product [Caenorhabditis auriculariae]